MASLNQCNFIGNLGTDPDIKYSASGAAITNISIACSESWKDKQSGEKVEKTEWVRVVFFGRMAEVAGEYLRKGSQVFVSGKMQTDKFTDQNGVEKYSTKVVAREMKMLSSKAGQSPQQGGFRNPANQSGVGVNTKDSGSGDGDIPF